MGDLDHTITITDSAEDSLRGQLSEKLGIFNAMHAGQSQGRLLAVLLHDGNRQLAGGLWAVTSYGWLSIQLFFLPEQLRGLGIGTKMLRMAENEARARSCHSAWLDTYEFQASEFYQRLGYKIFGQLENYPKGFSRFFMSKVL